jgi:ribonuclease BN (tRNA processing enzyme)
MQVAFLGTNGWYDTPIGNTISVLVQTIDYDIILDAGNGIAKADRYITQDKPVYLLLSHLHIDHIAGLHTLCKFQLKKDLQIFTQQGTRNALNTFVNDPYSIPFSRLPYNVSVKELAEGIHEIPFILECRSLVHPTPCFGYRLELEGKVITFCTDTLVCDNAIKLARNADLLILECGLKVGESPPNWPHISPADAIYIALKARANRLALVHFGPDVYRTLDDRAAIELEFKPKFPELIVAQDDMTIEL